VSPGVPWANLGLARVRVCVGDDAVWLEDGTAGLEPDIPEIDRLPCAVYPADSDEVLGDGTIDLRLLARVLHPTCSDHGLTAIAALHGVEGSGSVAAAAVLAGMIEEAIGLDRELVALLARLLPNPLSNVFDRILLMSRPEPATDAERPASDVREIDLGDVVATGVLGAEGIVARALTSYEERTGQLEMAEAVQEAFRDGEALLVEAGPGTGKTFAYLVPAILTLRGDASARVIVSTRTKQLQEQLYGKDLPFLLAQLAPNLKVALLKGRENYLCLRRWQSLIGELVGGLDRDRLTRLAPLARWLVESETGDIEENGAFQGDPDSRALWGRLCDSAIHCVGVFCPFLEDCFSIAARRQARKADLVVVNHSLLLGDLAVGGVVLGKYTHLVVDEAHNLEEAARAAFTRSLSERIVSRVVDDLAGTGRRQGWLRRLTLPGGDGDVGRVTENATTVRRRSATLFRALDRVLPEDRRGAFSSLSGVEGTIGEATAALEQLAMALDRLGERIDEDETRKELEGHIDRVSGLGEVARAITVPPAENVVHWYERDRGGPALHATPLDVAPFFQQLLYPRVESVVFTSATLSLAGDFDYVSRSLGLTDGILRVRATVVESPFAYRDRMKVAVPAYFPTIDTEGEAYVDGLASLLATLATRLDRKGLALFTSYQMLHAVRDRIPREIPTYAQGIDGPRSKLIERFRAHRSAGLLLGTESFWEGVDLPGEEMEFLVITRLPFSVPTDPILSALADRVAREGRDPFRDLSLPKAILKLRQGVGRLIRTDDDHGIVVLTDQRVLSRSYGARFLASLPVPAEAYHDEAELVEAVTDWFAGSK
jgi:ATP-dependent DNA helicase DinG